MQKLGNNFLPATMDNNSSEIIHSIWISCVIRLGERERERGERERERENNVEQHKHILPTQQYTLHALGTSNIFD